MSTSILESKKLSTTVRNGEGQGFNDGQGRKSRFYLNSTNMPQATIRCEPLAESWKIFKRAANAYNRIEINIDLRHDSVGSIDVDSDKKINETKNG